MSEKEQTSEPKRERRFAILADIGFSLLTAGLSYLVVEREGKKILNQEFLRAHAPNLAKDVEMEAVFARTIAKLDTVLRMALLMDWIPSLGPHRNADFKKSIAEMVEGTGAAGRSENEGRALEILTHLALLPDNDARLEYAHSLEFMKLHEEDYLIVKAINTGKKLANRAKTELKTLQTRIEANTDAELQKLAATRGRLTNLKTRLRR